MKTNHITVLLHEAVDALEIKKNHWYIDATFGAGGHTKQILGQEGRVIAFDFDQEAIKQGQTKFAEEIRQGTLILINENFNKIEESISRNHSEKIISGAIFDLGTSTDQLMNEQRGFSFSGEGELDMRMDLRLGVKAKDLLALLSEKQLAGLFLEYGGETEARKIAKKISELRKQGKFITTNKELSELVEKTKQSRGKTHPATKVFQALRIAVNDELDNLFSALPQALEVMEAGAKLVVISFHEGEDRIVKNLFKNWQTQDIGTMDTKKPHSPSPEEVESNPRSRSAKMRVFEKKNEK